LEGGPILGDAEKQEKKFRQPPRQKKRISLLPEKKETGGLF